MGSPRPMVAFLPISGRPCRSVRVHLRGCFGGGFASAGSHRSCGLDVVGRLRWSPRVPPSLRSTSRPPSVVTLHAARMHVLRRVVPSRRAELSIQESPYAVVALHAAWMLSSSLVAFLTSRRASVYESARAGGRRSCRFDTVLELIGPHTSRRALGPRVRLGRWSPFMCSLLRGPRSSVRGRSCQALRLALDRGSAPEIILLQANTFIRTLVRQAPGQKNRSTGKGESWTHHSKSGSGPCAAPPPRAAPCRTSLSRR